MDQPQGLLLWANVVVCFPLGPIAWLWLGFSAVNLSRRPGTRIKPAINLKPGTNVRGLLTTAAIISVILTVGFFLYFGSLLRSEGWAGFPYAVMIACDALTVALFAVYASVVSALRSTSDLDEPQVGLELWVALLTTLVGSIPPAVLALAVWTSPKW